MHIYIYAYIHILLVGLFLSIIVPINNIIPTSLFHILVVTLAILYTRNYSLVQILI